MTKVARQPTGAPAPRLQSVGLNFLPKREKQRMIGASRESGKMESTHPYPMG
nr:MAG TPA: hypothetical protein [Caudoviricetes sp.]